MPSVAVIKKKTLSMKAFYEMHSKLIKTFETDKHWNAAKITKVTSAGPVVVYEARTYLDIKSVSDKIKSTISRSEEVVVAAGKGPMQQFISRAPIACFNALKEAAAGDEKGTFSYLVAIQGGRARLQHPLEQPLRGIK